MNVLPPGPGAGSDPVGVVAGTAAQEIGSALTAIQVAVDRLERSLPDPERAPPEFGLIREQSERLARLARYLLELSRPARDAGAPRPLDVGWFLRRITAPLERELAASAIELRLAAPASPGSGGYGGPVVRADAERVREVLLALVANARTAAQAAPPPRWIRIVLDPRPDGGAEIRVSDSGPGVPEGAEERIFLPFVSGWGGHGMGLSRSRRTLADAGGGLRLNRLAGGNCEFVLTLEPFIQESP